MRYAHRSKLLLVSNLHFAEMGKPKRLRSNPKLPRRNDKAHNKANRPSKLREWSDEAMRAAMSSVQGGEMSINRAAIEHGVPKTTLKDRMSGRVLHGSNSGPKPYLSKEEEGELSDYLVNCSKMGYGKTRSQVLQIVEEIALKKGRKMKHVTDEWYRRFKRRVPIMTLRRGDPYANVRAQCSNRGTYESYFKLLKQVLDEHGLTDKPGQIYNCDESGMPFDARPLNVITSKHLKKVRSRTSGNKSQTTVLACANAAGQVIPPMVIFDLKNLQQELTKGEVPGTLYMA